MSSMIEVLDNSNENTIALMFEATLVGTSYISFLEHHVHTVHYM